MSATSESSGESKKRINAFKEGPASDSLLPLLLIPTITRPIPSPAMFARLAVRALSIPI